MVYKIIEVEKRPTVELNSEAEKSVLTLQSHSGFQYLVAKLRLQKAALELQLKGTRHEDLRAVDFLQSGIFWCGWLDSQLALAVQRLNRNKTAADATQIEFEAFDQAKQQIELVGEV